MDSSAEGPGFKSQPGSSLRQTVHIHRASVHQAAKLIAALLRFARVTAGLAESNGSLPPGLWLTSPAGWLPRTGISSKTLRSAIEYGLPLTTGRNWDPWPPQRIRSKLFKWGWSPVDFLIRRFSRDFISVPAPLSAHKRFNSALIMDSFCFSDEDLDL